jgi:hypothetical protein
MEERPNFLAWIPPEVFRSLPESHGKGRTRLNITWFIDHQNGCVGVSYASGDGFIGVCRRCSCFDVVLWKVNAYCYASLCIMLVSRNVVRQYLSARSPKLDVSRLPTVKKFKKHSDTDVTDSEWYQRAYNILSLVIPNDRVKILHSLKKHAT